MYLVTSPCHLPRFLWGFAHLTAASKIILMSSLTGTARDWCGLPGAWLLIALSLLFWIQKILWIKAGNTLR